MAEVATIGRTYHINLVRLYGFWFEESVDVYGYMEKESVDMYLFDQSEQSSIISQLKLQKESDTCKRIAKRGSFTHIKPANILFTADPAQGAWRNVDFWIDHMALCTAKEKEFVDKPHPLNLENVQLDCSWQDATCPICLDFPHNSVLLHCSSYHKGCRPFMCDTDQAHSNCLERFKSAHGKPIVLDVTSTTHGVSMVCIQDISSNSGGKPACPLCRGDVTGWVVIDDARVYLNMKRRCCEERHCSYVGNFLELQKHAQPQHPHSRLSEIDPVRPLDWDNFQQSSEIVDVSTIHAEVPHGIVLGDYVIEYGDGGTAVELEDFPRSRSNWLASCISCEVFNWGLRNRHRSRGSGRRRRSHLLTFEESSNLGEGSRRSVDIRDYRIVETDEELVRTGAGAGESNVNSNSYR